VCAPKNEVDQFWILCQCVARRETKDPVALVVKANDDETCWETNMVMNRGDETRGLE
jgi:hypothetical protein